MIRGCLVTLCDPLLLLPLQLPLPLLTMSYLPTTSILPPHPLWQMSHLNHLEKVPHRPPPLPPPPPITCRPIKFIQTLTQPPLLLPLVMVFPPPTEAHTSSRTPVTSMTYPVLLPIIMKVQSLPEIHLASPSLKRSHFFAISPLLLRFPRFMILGHHLRPLRSLLLLMELTLLNIQLPAAAPRPIRLSGTTSPIRSRINIHHLLLLSIFLQIFIDLNTYYRVAPNEEIDDQPPIEAPYYFKVADSLDAAVKDFPLPGMRTPPLLDT